MVRTRVTNSQRRFYESESENSVSEPYRSSKKVMKPKSPPKKKPRVFTTPIFLEGKVNGEEIRMRIEGESGYHYEKREYSIHNFAVGDYMYIFLNRTDVYSYDLMFKITPNEKMIEVEDQRFILKEGEEIQYSRSRDRKYGKSVEGIFRLERGDKIHMVFYDPDTKIVFLDFLLNERT